MTTTPSTNLSEQKPETNLSLPPNEVQEVVANFEKRVEIINARFKAPEDLPDHLKKSYWPVVIRKSVPEDERFPRDSKLFFQVLNLSPVDFESIIAYPRFYDDVLERTQAWSKSKLPDIAHKAFANTMKTATIASLKEFQAFAEGVKDKDSNTTPLDGNLANTLLHMTEKQRKATLKRISKGLSKGQKLKDNNPKGQKLKDKYLKDIIKDKQDGTAEL